MFPWCGDSSCGHRAVLQAGWVSVGLAPRQGGQQWGLCCPQVMFLSSSQPSKRSTSELCGRNDGNIKVIFPAARLEEAAGSEAPFSPQPGDYVLVKVSSALLPGPFPCTLLFSRAGEAKIRGGPPQPLCSEASAAVSFR